MRTAHSIHMIILHKNSHILSTEYEDTQQVHTTLRKRRDSKPKEQPRIEETPQDREEGVQIVEVEDERVTEVIEEDQKKKQEETEEELIIVERGKKGQLKQKKKRKESLEAETEIEQEEEVIQKVNTFLKPQRPNIGEDELELEEIEEFEIISETSIPSVALNIPSQISEVIALNRTVEQAPGKPQDEKAKITLDTVNALTEEYLPTHESGLDEVKSLKPDKRKAAVSISPMEPYSTTETTVQGGLDEFSDTFKPSTFSAISAIVPSESLVVSETLPSEAKPSDLKNSIQEVSGRAEVTMTLQEATTISETTVSQDEVPTEDFVSPNTVNAEDTMLPQLGLTIYEVNEGQAEDKLEPMKTVSTKPRVNFTTMEPVVVEEVHAQDKPGKYYPELIVPTEVASATIISQTQRVTEEMHAPEKEGEYVPGRLPAGQTALVQVSYGGETAITQEQPIQESEGIFSPDRKVDTFEAHPNVNLLESITVSTVDSQHQESTLTVDESKEVTADFNIVESSSIITTETITTERERQYHPDDKPATKTAETTIFPLEIGSISSTVVQESEGEFVEGIKPTAALAETSFKPEEYLQVSEVQTADHPSEFEDNLKFVTESGTITVQTSEAKEIQEVVVQYQENKMEDMTKPEERTVDTTYDAIRSVEIFQTTSVEKEGDLKIHELPESHRGKAVPSQPVLSLQVEETKPEDTLGQVTDIVPTSATAKVERDDLRETVVGEIVTAEGLGPVEQDAIPDFKVAKVGIDEMESVRTTEVVITEKETEYTRILEDKKAFASTEFATQIAATHQEVRTESPTNESIREDIPNKEVAQPIQTLLESITVSVQELAEKENTYSEDVKPTTKTATIELTETRSGAVTLEIVTSDRENLYSPETMTQPDFIAQPLVDAHPTAVKTETITEQSTTDITTEAPKTNKAFSRQEALEELIITETNIAETEKPRDAEVKPTEHSAKIEMEAAENLTVNELVTVFNKVCIFSSYMS